MNTTVEFLLNKASDGRDRRTPVALRFRLRATLSGRVEIDRLREEDREQSDEVRGMVGRHVGWTGGGLLQRPGEAHRLYHQRQRAEGVGRQRYRRAFDELVHRTCESIGHAADQPGGGERQYAGHQVV